MDYTVAPCQKKKEEIGKGEKRGEKGSYSHLLKCAWPRLGVVTHLYNLSTFTGNLKAAWATYREFVFKNIGGMEEKDGERRKRRKKENTCLATTPSDNQIKKFKPLI